MSSYTHTVAAAEQPELAQQMIDKALAPEAAKASVPPPPPSLPDTIITLPAGLRDLHGAVERRAEVRELDGTDEEAIARAKGSLPKILDTILSRGVVAVGDKPADATVLEALLAGDRDALVLGIRRATFGDEIELNIVCPACKAEQRVTLSCEDDIPVRTLGDDDREFEVTLRSGKVATVSLPDGASQKALAALDDKTEARLRTTLLKHCVQEIDGFPVMREAEVKALSIRDRDALVEEINKRNPGPQLQEVSRSCAECSESIPLPLTLVDLFPL